MPATFTIAPDYASPASVKPEIATANFGDGYSQRVPQGINWIGEEWDLTFSARTPSERDALLAFFVAQGGYLAFNWTSPSGTTGKFVATNWGYSPTSAAANSVSAHFSQVFEP
jgi:phage-related protein